MFSSNGRQLSYGREEVPLLPGQLIYDSDAEKSFVFTYFLSQFTLALAFGLGVVRDLVDGGIRLPRADLATVTFNANFVASNVINAKVNGLAIAPVTFATDSATTLAALATAIALMDGVASAVSDPSSKSILVTGDTAAVLVTNVVVTLGASQATAVVTRSSTDRYLGQPIYDPMAVSGDGFVQGPAIAVATHTQGVTAYVSHDVLKGDTAYMNPVDGTYTNVSTNNIPTFGQFNSDAISGGLAIIILNLPQG